MRTLTARGRAMAVAGVAGGAAGWALGQPAIIALAILLVLLPAIGVVVVRRSRFVLGSSRRVQPTRIPFGSTAEVVLSVENGSRLPSGALLLEDAVPAALGDPARILLDRVPPRGHRVERYPLAGRQRGRQRIGPLTVTVTDPFGTARLVRSFSTTTSVVVTPQIVPLGRGGASLTSGGQGEAMFRAVASRGDDDVLPREHRPGDDMRRIHWRATARQGELMVRREEQAWHSSMVVLLDDRARAHEGTGSADSFEWAVSAAASIAVHYLSQGWRLTALTTSGRVLIDATQPLGTELDGVLQAFADIRTVDASLSRSLRLDVGAATAVVAVLGRLADDDATALPHPSGGFAGCLALEPAPLDLLRAGGWRAVGWNRGASVAAAWDQVSPTATRADAGVGGRA